jgi:cation transport ATPase
VNETMAMTMLTPRDTTATSPATIVPAFSRWRRAMIQSVRQNLLPWLAVKAVLTALVLTGQVGVWTAFVLDTLVSALVLGYSWWLARR